ncbi:hypothetical protein vseg_001048 [Gypsophila vaccaria]
MARGKAVAVPVMALLFGLAAAGLSWLAYAKRIKAEDISIDGQGVCSYPSSAAFAVGIVAALFILLQQILISVGTACFCCGRNKFPCNICGIIAFILFFLSWASFVITFVGLIYTAVINDRSYLRKQNNISIGHKKEDCLMGKETLFLGAAVWCVFTVIFSLATYATFTCGLRKHKARKNHATALPA